MAGELSINIEVTVEDALRQMERFRRETTRAAQESRAQWDDILGTSTLSKVNIARAALVGVSITAGAVTKSFGEWAKVSRDARNELDELRSSWVRLQQGIGADAQGSGAIRFATNLLDETAFRLDVIRGTIATGGAGVINGIGSGMMGSARAFMQGDPLSAPTFALTSAVGGFFGTTAPGMSAVMRVRSADIDAQRRAEYASQTAAFERARLEASGDAAGVARLDFNTEMAAINAERRSVPRGDGARRERLAALDAREGVAYARFASTMDNAMQAGARESDRARREAETQQNQLRLEQERVAAKEKAAKLGDMDLSFQLRALEVESKRLEGDEAGADIAATRLQFEQLRFDVMNRNDLTGPARNAALSRIDALEASRVALLGSAESGVPSGYQAPGMVNSGLSGIASIGRQAFAGGTGQNVEVQQLQVLKRIETAVKNTSGARFN